MKSSDKIKDLVDSMIFLIRQNDAMAKQIALNNEDAEVMMHQIDFLMKKGEKEDGNTVRKAEQI